MEKPLLNIVFIFLIQFISRLLFFLHLKNSDVLIQWKKNNLNDNNIESKSAQQYFWKLSLLRWVSLLISNSFLSFLENAFFSYFF